MTTLIIDGTPSAVVPAEPTAAMADAGSHAMWRSALRNPDNSREIWQSMLSAADPSLTEAVLEMRAALANLLLVNETDMRARKLDPADFRSVRDARAVLARITIQETSDRG